MSTSIPALPTGTKRERNGFFYFALFLSFSTFFLIMAGGLVTSHEAGLSVPDWPLSYGQWFPPMVGNIFWEHGHRMIAGFVGLMMIGLTAATQIWEKRTYIKILTWIALLAVIGQAILGGLTVIYHLPPAISILHACLAQTFLCLVIALAFFHSALFRNGDERIVSEKARKTHRLFTTTVAMIYLQLIMGAIVRHTPFTAVPHIILGLLVLFHVILMAAHVKKIYPSRIEMTRPVYLLAFMTILQVVLGFGALAYTRMAERGDVVPTAEVAYASAHQSLGAAILAVCFLVTLMVRAKIKEG